MVGNYKLQLIGLLVLIALVGFFWLRPDNNERLIKDVPAKTTAGQITIVAFGDSLTAGYSLPVSEAYPALLQTALVAEGQSVRVINSGVSGETTRGNLERAAFIRSQNPDIVLLGIGGNDALRQLPLEEAKANITKTIQTLKEGENPPVIILLRMQAPLNAGLAYKQAFDAMYGDIADAEKVILSPFLTTEVYLDGTNRLPDGIHLNTKGYGIIVNEYLLPTILPLLEQMNS